MSDTMQKIVSLCKRRGFVFPGSEIYGGLANSWDYGPLGAQLRKNIKDSWWKTFVEKREDMLGLDGAVILNPRVWEASGHVATFNDPLVEDVKTHKRYRADHLLEDAGVNIHGMDMAAMAQAIQEQGIKSPDGNALSEPRQFNLMFQTTIGPVQEDGNTVYLRPETAQAIFVNFKNVLTSSRKRIPFGIGQIGKAFRNEITPGNFIFRTLEFEQMEIEYFIEEKDWKELFTRWENAMQDWAKSIGLDVSKISLLDIPKEELAHYSKKTIDIEFEFPFGKKELWGLAYRTDFDLRSHQEHSKEKLEYTDPDDNKRKFLPHVIEPSFGVDRTLLALLVSAYKEEVVDGEERIVLQFAPNMAPYQVAVLPLMKKEPLGSKAKEVFEMLQKNFRVEYDDSGSIGKRYRREDEIGTPFCITIDFDTVENGSVTIRERDSMKQERISISELVSFIEGKIV
ncbi:MAG: glycine--tRNA ligase [Candidatus Magasanikbacteria bacterium]